MHDAQLNDGLRPDHADRIRQPGQAIAAHDAHVADAPRRISDRTESQNFAALPAAGRADPQAQDIARNPSIAIQ